MDDLVSTYQKDFNWPFVKTFPIRTEKQAFQTPIKSHCICGSEPGGALPPKEYVGPLEGDTYQWSRLGPMAPLLDPKVYPAKVGPAPEFEIMHHDQPNTYLKKLQERYPYLYNVLQTAPPDELIRRVNEDRLRTTYQMDYSHMDEHPSADYEKLLARAGVSVCSKLRSSPKENLPILDCRSKLRPPEYEAPIQPTSLTIEILARNDAGGFPMGPRDQDREYYRDVEFDPRDVDNDYPDRRNRPVDMERNDYDEPRDRTERSRNRGPHKSGAERFANAQDRPVNDPRDHGAKSKNLASGPRETGTRGNEVKGDQSSRTNGARDRGGNRGEGQGGRGEGEATRPTDVATPRGGSRPADGGDARTAEAGNSGGGSAAHEGGGGTSESGKGNEAGGGARGNEGGGGASKKSAVGFGSGEESKSKSKTAHKAKEAEDASRKPLPAWQSEYQEVIGQTGTNIIKDKMHHQGGHFSGRKLMERIIRKCPT